MARRRQVGFRAARRQIRIARKKAEDLLQGYSWVVFRVAAQLLRTGSLDGSALEEIFKKGGIHLPQVEWEAIP